MSALRRRTLLAAAALLLGSCAGAQHRDAAAMLRVRLAIAERMGERGEWAAALDAADAIAREDPSSAAARVLRARALRHHGMLVEAESDLRRVLASEPRNAAAHAELGVVCDLGRRSEEALRNHEEAHRLAPGDPRFLNNLAFALMLRSRPREAIPLLEEALQREPGNARIRNNLGFAHAATGDFARSAQQFRLANAPAQAQNNLGIAYERSGQLAQAYEAYLAAWRLQPEPVFRENLVHAAEKLGRTVPPEVAPAASAEKGGS